MTFGTPSRGVAIFTRRVLTILLLVWGAIEVGVERMISTTRTILRGISMDMRGFVELCAMVGRSAVVSIGGGHYREIHRMLLG
jgi:hypothetical protein